MSSDGPAETWLDHEDRACRDGRLHRLNWIAGLAPKGNYWLFQGGTAKRLFEEARYCFVYGQFLAAILLGAAFVEIAIAAQLYASGRNDAKRARFARLLEEASKAGWISDIELAHFGRVRMLRNRIAHFREPLGEGTVEHDALARQSLPYELLEEDARMIMSVAMRLLQRDTL